MGHIVQTRVEVKESVHVKTDAMKSREWSENSDYSTWKKKKKIGVSNQSSQGNSTVTDTAATF